MQARDDSGSKDAACHVCGKETNAETAHARLTLQGVTYLVCCPMCHTALEAGAVQRRLMPASHIGPLAHVTARYLPALHVGGDFASVDQRDGRRLSLVMGDVSGHGVTAALVSSRLVPEIEARLRETDDLGSVAIAINELLLGLFAGGHTYATLFLAVADPTQGRLRHLSCGHPPALLWRVTDGAAAEPLPGVHYPVGLVGPEVFGVPATLETKIQPGDRLLAYSDGLLELLSDAPTTEGVARLSRLFGRLARRMPRGGEERVFAALAARHALRAVDDVAYLMVRFRSLVAGGDRDEGGRRLEGRDPVCGMAVSVDTPHRIPREGGELLFCSRACMETFRESRGAPGIDVTR